VSVCHFSYFDAEKFSNQRGTHWVLLFSEIGFGTWFRYTAGLVEMGGALLILIPCLEMAGFALLGLTMGVATVIAACILKKLGQKSFSL
jgi:hypothetical protein